MIAIAAAIARNTPTFIVPSPFSLTSLMLLSGTCYS